MRRIGIAVLCLALWLVSACSIARTYRAEVAPAPGVPAECPRTAGELGLSAQPVRYIDGAIPADFVAVKMIYCHLESLRTVSTSEGIWTVAQLTGPVPRSLMDALALPDLVDPKATCSLDAVRQPYVLLVNDKQQAVRPRLPLDQCGKVRGKVTTAIERLAPTLIETGRFDVQFKDPGRTP